MTVSVLSADLYIHNIRARMPFRYGIAELKTIPHLFVRLDCEIDGQRQYGFSADGLIPKWFTKDPATTYQADVNDMLAVIQSACQFAVQASAVSTVFALWQTVYTHQRAWALEQNYPPLLWNFGVSLVERAIIDAYCRASGITLFKALQTNAFGIRLDEIHSVLAGCQPADLLPARPASVTIVRHTIGLSDPLTDDEIAAEDKLSDGLPQSLQANLQTYGLTHFKVKLSGVLSKDIYRLRRILGVIQGSGRYYLTLDGNEQFMHVAEFKNFWRALEADASLGAVLRRLLYVEQPLHRDTALCTQNQEPLRRWTDRPPMIIDESDSELDSLKIALDCGYNGTSHKNCKGIIKSIANACLLEHLRRSNTQNMYILSGEDLVNIGPIALLQDLAMVAALGIRHTERNGHHYFSGLSMFPIEVQNEMLEQHPDLYRQRRKDFATLQIEKGKISLKSVNLAPFGLNPEINLERFIPLEVWNFDCLEKAEM